MAHPRYAVDLRDTCAVCRNRPAEGTLLCGLCGKSYDRARDKDITIHACIEWAAKRARHFERDRAQAQREELRALRLELRQVQNLAALREGIIKQLRRKG